VETGTACARPRQRRLGGGPGRHRAQGVGMSGAITVLHLRACNFVGGPERQILRYCAAPSLAGDYRQVLATFTAHPAEGEGHELLAAARKRNIEAFELHGGGRRDWAAARELDRLVQREQVRLICAHGYRADLIGSWVARRRGIPCAWFLRGYTGENAKVRTFEALDRMLLRLPERRVCLSDTQARKLPRRLASRTAVVVNAIEERDAGRSTPEAARAAIARRYPALLEGTTSPLLVAIAGRLSPEKGARHFLQAAARVAAGHADARFLVFGDGPMRERLEAGAARRALGARVHFAGHVPDWTSLLPGLDLVVNPSLSEQAPNVVLEAMAAGVPVLATRVGAVAEIGDAEGDEPGLQLVEPGNESELAARMQALLADRDRRLELGRRGQARVRSAYTPATQARQLRNLFEHLVAAPAQQPQRWPAVSVVVPVRNEARHLGGLLDQILGQDYPPEQLEVIVADGGSEDGTAGIIAEYAARHPDRVRGVDNPGLRSSAGRNAGVAAARGEWIVFVDGHCTLPGRDWLRQQMAEAAGRQARCLSRPQPLQAEKADSWQATIAHVRASRLGHGADSTIYDTHARGWVHPGSSGAAYQAAVFDQIGGYDESFDACEDVEFNERVAQAGMQAWQCPEAVVHYAARRSLDGLWRQMVRYGRGRVRLMRKHRQARSAAQWLPAAWLLWLPVGVAGTALGSGDWRLLNAAGLALYAGALAAGAAGVGWRHGWRHGLRAPAVYFTIHAGLGGGALREVFPQRAATGRLRLASNSISRSDPS